MTAPQKLILLTLAFILGLLAQNASAELATSSYAEAVGNWQGSAYYDEYLGGEDYLRGRVDFAVYDTQNLIYSAEKAFINSIDMPEMDRFLYTYQIFNDYDDISDEAVSYFAIFNPQQTVLNVDANNIGSKDDGAGGIEPTSESLKDDGTRVEWDFAGGLIYNDGHSWYLLFSAGGAPTAGDYEVRAPQSDEIPAPIPEPATVALLGIGGVALIRRKRRFVS